MDWEKAASSGVGSTFGTSAPEADHPRDFRADSASALTGDASLRGRPGGLAQGMGILNIGRPPTLGLWYFPSSRRCLCQTCPPTVFFRGFGAVSTAKSAVTTRGSRDPFRGRRGYDVAILDHLPAGPAPPRLVSIRGMRRAPDGHGAEGTGPAVFFRSEEPKDVTWWTPCHLGWELQSVFLKPCLLVQTLSFSVCMFKSPTQNLKSATPLDSAKGPKVTKVVTNSGRILPTALFGKWTSE